MKSNKFNAFVSTDYDKYGYLISNQDNNQVLAFNFSEIHNNIKNHERKHYASLKAILAVMNKMLAMSIDNAKITVDNKLVVDLLGNNLDIKPFSLNFKKCLQKIKNTAIFFNSIQFEFRYDNPLKKIVSGTSITQTTSSDIVSEKWKEANGIVLTKKVVVPHYPDEHTIIPNDSLRVYTGGDVNRFQLIIRDDSEQNVYSEFERIKFEKGFMTEAQSIQMGILQTSLRRLIANNFSKVIIYFSDESMIKQIYGNAKVDQYILPYIEEVRNLLKQFAHAEIIFFRKKNSPAYDFSDFDNAEHIVTRGEDKKIEYFVPILDDNTKTKPREETLKSINILSELNNMMVNFINKFKRASNPMK
ncbi:hypothetical protein [Paenibacillus sp. O199]|uniref:hypothetical protein n=1 Tax=Paenibacillus sp. O199 TaxID=1643925 RepID=UPI0007BFA3C9|nr:hypothetical protein [Paenibacillus sp. O199]